jgi:hypothetical protein
MALTALFVEEIGALCEVTMLICITPCCMRFCCLFLFLLVPGGWCNAKAKWIQRTVSVWGQEAKVDGSSEFYVNIAKLGCLHDLTTSFQ